MFRERDSLHVKVSHHQPYQEGSALIVSMVILLLMTLIGVTALQNSSMQERMAGNTRDSHVAFQAAEFALRDAEQLLASSTTLTFNNTDGLWQPTGAGEDSRWLTINWETGSEYRTSPKAGLGLDDVSRDPAFIIERLGSRPGSAQNLASDQPLTEINVFRITARGWGASDNTQTILQSVFLTE